MSDLLNASEILEFAVYIEQKGYQFYTESAKKLNDLKLMGLFNVLAEEELMHEHSFKKLQKEVGSFTPEESYDGEYQGYMKDYLKTFTPTTNEKMIKLVKRVNSVGDAVEMALGFEKDSVVFYNLLKNFVSGESKKMVDNIIQEEVRHVLRLNNFKSENIPEAPDVDAM
ncbi:MAG: ferritin family protein [Candidatus Aminicenantes bacterium]|nr:ferritin family protein [Candidatus Aminicenantes bacterium]